MRLLVTLLLLTVAGLAVASQYPEGCANNDPWHMHGLPTKTIAALDPNYQWPINPELEELYAIWVPAKAEWEQLGKSRKSAQAMTKEEAEKAGVDYKISQQCGIKWATIINKYVYDHCPCPECVRRRKEAERYEAVRAAEREAKKKKETDDNEQDASAPAETHVFTPPLNR